ncbi:hypothetical protein GGR56DRAFT_675218 [Xylariaceae sp. FL0804]|nr:hypothetical protein GGR56DRAFT_675218 [Xylariaceae sp. FL0804]
MPAGAGSQDVASTTPLCRSPWLVEPTGFASQAGNSVISTQTHCSVGPRLAEPAATPAGAGAQDVTDPTVLPPRLALEPGLGSAVTTMERGITRATAAAAALSGHGPGNGPGDVEGPDNDPSAGGSIMTLQQWGILQQTWEELQEIRRERSREAGEEEAEAQKALEEQKKTFGEAEEAEEEASLFVKKNASASYQFHLAAMPLASLAAVFTESKVLNDRDEPIHIIMDRTTSKTGDAFVELDNVGHYTNSDWIHRFHSGRPNAYQRGQLGLDNVALVKKERQTSDVQELEVLKVHIPH